MSCGEEDEPELTQKGPGLAGPFGLPRGFLARFGPPFDLAPSRSICSSLVRRPPHPTILLTSIHQKTRRHKMRDEIR
jgi:hypothetical protein